MRRRDLRTTLAHGSIDAHAAGFTLRLCTRYPMGIMGMGKKDRIMAYFFTRGLAALALVLLASLAQAQQEYRAQPGDTLTIEVLEDASLNRSVQILPDGRFSFPFAGSMRGAGRSVSQIQNDITTAINANFASTPTVFVSLQPKERIPVPKPPVEPKTINIYFLGEVATPGLREVAPGTTFLQAMAQAGGLTRFAATKRVQLRSTNPTTGKQSLRSFDYKAISEGALLSVDPELNDGDVILVPERRLFE